MTMRLSRRRPIWQAALTVVPLAVGLGVLVVGEPGDDASARHRSLSTQQRDVSTTVESRALPRGLAVIQLERQADALPVDELTTVAASPSRSPGERYLALRRLEREAPGVAVAEAERLVMAAQGREDGFLALNALATLARLPEGRESLARCAAQAPTRELRDAAVRLASR